MSNQVKLINVDIVLKLIDKATNGSIKNSEQGTVEWFDGEVNRLGIAKDIILSGQFDPDRVSTINPGDKRQLL